MAPRKRDPVSREPFGDVLQDVRLRLGWKWNALARAMGVSPRTLVRWVYHRDMPAPERRVAIVAALRDLPTDLVVRLSACLEVDPRVAGLEGAKGRAPVPERARGVLDAAIYAAADAIDVRAADLRAAIVPVLTAIAELGIDAASARALIDAKRG